MQNLALIFCISLFMGMAYKAVEFHRATVCRQEAWLKGVELSTQTLLSSPPQSISYIKKCRIIIHRQEKSFSWRRLPKLKSHTLSLHLKEKL